MTGPAIGALDRDFVNEVLSTRDHHVQNSLSWFDFLKDYSGETDCSSTFFVEGKPVGFVLALQYKNLIQSLPYPASYSGVCFLPEIRRDVRCAVVQELFKHYADRADAFTLCTSPFFGDGDLCEEQFDYAVGNRILFIDLSRPLLTGTNSKFRNNLKRNLRKAKDAGVVLYRSNDEATLKEWHGVYEKRMAELDAPTLDYAYFAAMRRHLAADNQFELFNARIGGRYLGGIIIVHNKFCADYYLSVFDRDCDDTQASTCLFHEALAWAKEQRIHIFNLQASPASQTALYEFKKSWGAVAGSHQYLVKILKNKDALLRQSAEQIKREYRFHFLLPFEALAATNNTAMNERKHLQPSR